MPYKNVDEQREYQRRWKQEHARKPTSEERRAYRKAYKEKNPEKHAAQSKVSKLVYRKKFPKVSVFLCSDCDAKAQHYHHEDYSQPTIVEPLCHPCHAKRHHTK